MLGEGILLLYQALNSSLFLHASPGLFTRQIKLMELKPCPFGVYEGRKLIVSNHKPCQGDFSFSFRCFSISKRRIPAATETFKEEILPRRGIEIKKSQLFRIKSRIPSPSLPKTKTQFPLKSCLK